MYTEKHSSAESFLHPMTTSCRHAMQSAVEHDANILEYTCKLAILNCIRFSFPQTTLVLKTKRKRRALRKLWHGATDESLAEGFGNGSMALCICSAQRRSLSRNFVVKELKVVVHEHERYNKMVVWGSWLDDSANATASVCLVCILPWSRNYIQ